MRHADRQSCSADKIDRPACRDRLSPRWTASRVRPRMERRSVSMSEKLQNAQRNAVFCELADPETPTPDLADAQVPTLARMASDHNVATIVYRKLGAARMAQLAPDLVAEVEGLTAITLRLESLLPRLTAGFADHQVTPIIVKGPVFASRLYADPADRPFTDLDIVARGQDLAAIAEILGAMSLHQDVKPSFDRSDINQEQKWISAADPNLLIEVHGDLVHYPGLRRQVRMGHAELTALGPDAATTLFLTAVAHGALGHKFHTLRLVLDVLQAFRNLDQPARDALLSRARAARLHLETVQSLSLIGTMFGEDQALDLVRQARRSGTWALAHLITGNDVLSAPDAMTSRLRRHGFRLVQRWAAR